MPSAWEYHALHFLGYHANPKEMNMTIIKSYAAKEAGADLSL
ncbi:alcohol dehydrogenase, partial [Acinetobacter baumannii]|nr:alcohol dehydrogenase [Acinetobacter baumannii]